MRENETFLNSIEGRIKKFTTAVQTMWSNFINDDIVKFIVDVGTGIIELIDKIGLLESAIGALVGFSFAKNSIKDAFSAIDNGTFKFTDIFKLSADGNKEGSDHTTDAFKSVTDAAYTTADAFNAVADAAHAAADADKTQEASAMAAAEADAAEAAGSTASANADAAEARNSMRASNADAVEARNSIVASNADVVEANNSIRAATADAGEGVASAASAVTSTVGNVAGTVLGGKVAGTAAKAALSTGAAKAGAAILGGLKGILISAVISIVLDLLGKLVGGIANKFESEEKKIEKTTDALNEYNAKQEELKGQKETVNELAESYTRLSSGVNTLTNDNIGLTTEAYQEYLEVCNDIAAMFPELVSGYDAQGNAIINLTDKVNGLADAYRNAQEEAAITLLTDENKENVWTKYQSNDMNSAGKYWLANENGVHTDEHSVSLQDQRDILQTILSMGYDDLMHFYEADKAGGFFDGKTMWETLQRHMEKTGVPLSIEEAMGIFNSLIIPDIGDMTYDEYVAHLKNTVSTLNQTISDNMGGIRDMVSASLLFDIDYQQLDNESRKMVQAIIHNMDPNMIADSGAKNADEFISWFSKNVIAKVAKNKDLYSDLADVSNKMAKAMLDGDADAFEDAQAEFMALVSPEGWLDENGNIVVNSDDPVIQYLQQFAKAMQDKARNFEVRMAIRADVNIENPKPISEVVAEYTGEAKDEIQRTINDLELGEDATLGDIFGTIGFNLDLNDDGKLRTDEIQDVYDDYLSYIAGDMTAMDQYTAGQREAAATLHQIAKLYGTDVDTIIAAMVELGFAYESLDGIKSFDLASESTNEFVDKFQSDVDAIKDAWESLNSGEMTQSEFLDLAQEFPKLMEGVNFSDDNWMTQARANLEALNSTTVDDFIAELSEMKDAMAARGEDTTIVDSMIAYAEQQRDLSQIAAEVQADTVTGLTEVHERYKSIMEETNEILYNGQKVSEGYYESLAEYIDDTEALNACFDENNRQIVTNVDALKELIAKQHEADVQNVRLAKSQAQLEYYELVRQLGDATRSFVGLTAASDITVDSLLDQIGVVKDTIVQYQLLEDNLLGATSAFEKFAAAKELDEQNTYGASYAEMAQTMYDALYETGQVGSAQFWAAVEATVPDDIYKHLTPGTEQMRAIYDYFNKNIMPTLTFDEDSFSIDYSDIEAFIKKAQEVGVFSGTDAASFGLSSDFIYGLAKGENALEAFADRMGMTTAQVYAMLSEMDKYTTDGAGLSMLMQLDTSTSGQIAYITSELEKLYAQRRALIKQGASDTALGANMAQIYEYESQLSGLQKQATDAVQDYIVVQNALVDTSKTVREALPYKIWKTELQLTGDETVQEVLQQINDYVLTLQEPTVMDLQIARDSIDDELDGLIKRFTEKELKANVVLNEDGLYEIKDGNLTIDTAILDRYVELKNAQLFIDNALTNSMSVQEQLLTNIDKNVAAIAGEEPTSGGSDGDAPGNGSASGLSDGAIDTRPNTGDTSETASTKPGEKPAPNQAAAELTLNASEEISKLLEAIFDKQLDLSFIGDMTMADETAWDELEAIYQKALGIQTGLLNGDILAENALTQLSELKTQAALFGVEIPVTTVIEQRELETNVTEAADGLTIKPDVDLSDSSLTDQVVVANGLNEVKNAIKSGVGDAINEAASEVEALYKVYASPEEALAALDAIADKTYALTPDEALAFGWTLAEGEILTVADAINRLKQEQDALRRTSVYNPEQFQETATIVKTYSELQEEMSNYNEALEQTQEIISDNIEVSQEYKNSLKELGITEEELNECFDDSNPLLVTNAQLLNKLVKGARNNVATNIRLAKSQAQLEYYELYKEIAKLTDGTQEIDGATLAYIQSLYGQMGAIQKNIAQFSMLEAQLLGATNAYEQLEAAQAADSANDYGSRAEELVNILGHAFNTGELGTQAAQTAIAGLIPDDVIDKTKTLDEQMEQIYQYFTKGQVSKLFTIEFDDDGGITSVEMTKENVEAFTRELIEAGEVFHGTWDEFTLDPSIKTLDDFAEALGVTKEVAFAYLTELEKYDINWLGGDHETLLDQLMGDNLEYNIQKTTQKMAVLRQEMASLMEGGIDNTERGRFAEIEAELAELEGTMSTHRRTAYGMWQEYEAIDGVLSDTANMGKKVSDVFSSDIIAAVGLTGEETVKEAYNKLLAYQMQLGQPTDLVLQFASEQAMEKLNALKDELENNTDVDIEANVHFNNETGEFEYTGSTTGWSEEDVANLQAYLDMSGDLYEINQSLGLGIEAMEGYAQRTADAVESIDQKIIGDLHSKDKTDGDNGQSPSKKENLDTSTSEEATVVADQVTVEGSDDQVGSDEQVSDGDDASTTGQLTTPEATVISEHTTVETTGGTTDSGVTPTVGTATDTASEFMGATVIVTTIKEDENGVTINLPSLEDRTAHVGEYDEVDGGANKDEIQPLTTAKVGGYQLANYVLGKENINPSVTGNVTGYNPPDDSVVTNNVNPSVTGNVTGYIPPTNEVDTTNVNPSVVGTVTGYKLPEEEDDVNTVNVNPNVTGMVSGYQEHPGVNVDNLQTNRITARIIAYDDTGATRPEVVVGETTGSDTNSDEQTTQYTSDAGHRPPSLHIPAVMGLDEDTDGVNISWPDTLDMDDVLANNAAIEANLTVLSDGNQPEDVEVELQLDTTAAEEQVEELGSTAEERIAEILVQEGLEGLPLGRALYKYEWQPVTGGLPNIGFDTTIFTQVMQEAEYTEAQINALIAKIQEYDNVVLDNDHMDVLGLNNANQQINEFEYALRDLGVTYARADWFPGHPGTYFDGVEAINISVPSLAEALASHGWTPTEIQAYFNQLQNAEFTNFDVVFEGADKLDEVLMNLESTSITDKEFNTTANGASESMQAMEDINSYTISDKSYEIKTTYTSEYKVIGSSGGNNSGGGGGSGDFVNGTAHAQGTAHKGGSWGAPKTETALTGELGPELRVRGNRWELLGENGAEFNEVKKGDIIE